MKALLLNPIHRALLILIVITGTAFGMRNDGLAGMGIGVVTLAIVWFKGRLIVLDFMDLRHAPPVWRWVVQGWLILVVALVLLFYSMGRRGIAF